MGKARIFYLLCLIVSIFGMLPSSGKANYDHVLYFQQQGKYRLLIAFPKDNPDSSKAVLFSDNNWHLPRYSNSQQIRDFFAALGFKDKDARLLFRKKFQPDAAYDRFTSLNWQAFFNWLADMKIETINNVIILMKECSPVGYDELDKIYQNNVFFPVFTNLDEYLPKLDIEVNNLKTNIVEFGQVPVGKSKKLDVILTAQNMNNAILLISPIFKEYLDESITVNKVDTPLFLFNEISDTLRFVFSPADSQDNPIFWHEDTFAVMLPLKGDYLPRQENLFLKGIRKRKTMAIKYLIAKNLNYIVGAVFFVIVAAIIFWLFRQISKNKAINTKTYELSKTNLFKNDQSETTFFNPPQINNQSNLSNGQKFAIPDKLKNIPKQFSLYHLANLRKLKLSNGDINLIENIKKLYYDENADIREFIKVIQNYFQQDKDYNKKLFKEAETTVTKQQKQQDPTIEKLQWYKNFFTLLKKVSGNDKVDDSVAKKILIEKAAFSHPDEVYDAIDKYCYQPILSDYEKFDYFNKSIKDNINIFQKNREKLIKQKRHFEDLAIINNEQKYFIEGIKQGYILIKPQTNELENAQLDYEQFLATKQLCINTINKFTSFLKIVINQFNKIDHHNISECWLKIISTILVGKSGLAGISGCLERLRSFQNPLIVIKFFEINSNEKLKILTEENIKTKFRDRIILAPFCMPYLQDLRRLYLYLENKELRSQADEKLFAVVTYLNSQLFEIFKFYNIYLHQLKLFSKFDQKLNILPKQRNGTTSYLAQIDYTRQKLKQLISTGKLIDNYIYDVDAVGYDIVSENHKKKSKASEVYVYKKTTNNLIFE